MIPSEHTRPWELLLGAAERGDASALADLVEALSAAESARALAHLDEEGRRRVMTLLDAEDAADLLDQLSTAQAAEVVDGLEPGEAAHILRELPTETNADILRELDDEDAEAVIARLPADEARDVRLLRRWDDDVAGGLMTLEYVAVPVHSSVEHVVDLLRSRAHEFRDYHVQYVYVVDDGGALAGVLRLRDLLLARGDAPASALMIPDPISVDAGESLDDLADRFDKASFFGLPVVESGRLVGVVRRVAIEEALGEEAHRDHLKSQGIVGGEELRSMPLATRAGRRLSWLSINIVLNVIAASVIAAFQDTLEAVIALAVFSWRYHQASGVSSVRPSAPCAWIARSRTRWITPATWNLMSAMSSRAACEPSASIFQAVRSTSRRAASISARLSAIQSCTICRRPRALKLRSASRPFSACSSDVAQLWNHDRSRTGSSASSSASLGSASGQGWPAAAQRSAMSAAVSRCRACGPTKTRSTGAEPPRGSRRRAAPGPLPAG